MNKANLNVDPEPQAPEMPEEVHPLHKSYTFISTKNVDYENLSAFEAIAMSLALVLAVTAGVTTSFNLA